MAGLNLPSHEHTIKLRPGADATLRFRFAPAGAARELSVRLVGADPARDRYTLSLDSLWGFHEMRRRGASGEAWEPLHAGPDGRASVELDGKAGGGIYIGAEGAYTHSLNLERMRWAGGALELAFKETG